MCYKALSHIRQQSAPHTLSTESIVKEGHCTVRARRFAWPKVWPTFIAVEQKREQNAWAFCVVVVKVSSISAFSVSSQDCVLSEWDKGNNEEKQNAWSHAFMSSYSFVLDGCGSLICYITNVSETEVMYFVRLPLPDIQNYVYMPFKL